ncbi:hypothetical protein [Budvicia aquatica]|uniref:hypothetical protein n=1 Tax=Budvicia aquatica TaxID=82979 RepID=UPI00208C0283|nr:hypothetical protein [Budvicia aquatica]GKX53108.1 hypothetical protein SOASR029_34170 [Budvicia aquatica]
MRVEVRIKRILTNLERFKYIDGEDSILGKIYGVYDNSPEDDSLHICEDGIFWTQNGSREQIKYSDISDLSLSYNELPDKIITMLLDDHIVMLPVRGRNGKLADIYSILRFLRTTIDDLVKFKK